MPAITRYISRGLEDLVPPTPTRGDDLKSEIQCYSLPFGVLGFISHILTYWTIAWLLVGRRPFWPKREVNYGMWSMLLSSAGLGGTISMAFKTIKSCKNTWQLLVIAVWKLFMSFLSGITAIHVAMVVLMQKDMEWDLKKASKRAAWWIALYVPGMVAGMTGLMSLVVQHWDNRGIYGLTIAFYIIIGIGLVTGFSLSQEAFMDCNTSGRVLGMSATSFAIGTMFFTVLAAFYSDWTLGIMTDNLVGIPSSDTTAFYWTYWAAKRLFMFCW